MRKILFLLLVLPVSGVISGKVVVAQGTALDLRVLPLNCVFEEINDGSNTIHYLTPAECGVTVEDLGMGDSGSVLQPTAEASVSLQEGSSAISPHNADATPLQIDTIPLVTLCSDGEMSDGQCIARNTAAANGNDKAAADPVKRAGKGAFQYNIVMLSIGTALVAGIIVDVTFFRFSMTKTGVDCVGNLCRRLGNRNNKIK